MAQQRHLRKSPSVSLHWSSQKLVAQVYHDQTNKKGQKVQLEKATGSPPFWLSWPFSTFLLWRTCRRAFIRSTSYGDACHLNMMEIKTNSKIDFFITRCDRGVASKFDYTPSKYEVMYLGHIWSNRVQTRHVRQESRPDDIYTEIMT